jgi:AcrR family transcriptional regulator
MMSHEPKTAEPDAKRRRLLPDDREREIIDAAIRYFAEVGLQGSMRELAARLGITHANLFRYFSSKDVLVERVFEEVYITRWNPAWTALLQAADQPLGARLTAFYSSYLQTVSTFEWVRIFVIAGLGGAATSQRYLELIRRRIVVPVATELRTLAGLPSPAERPLSPEELEVVWGLHGQLFYAGIRRFVYDMTLPKDVTRIVAVAVDTFLDGAPVAFKRLAPGG